MVLEFALRQLHQLPMLCRWVALLVVGRGSSSWLNRFGIRVAALVLAALALSFAFALTLAFVIALSFGSPPFLFGR